MPTLDTDTQTRHSPHRQRTQTNPKQAKLTAKKTAVVLDEKEGSLERKTRGDGEGDGEVKATPKRKATPNGKVPPNGKATPDVKAHACPH